MRRMSLKRKLPVLLLVILVLGLSLHTGKSIQAALISKRRQAAETVIELFGKHLIQQLEAENFASKLMFALNTKEKTNLTLFEEKAAKLQKDHAEIRFLSYFEQDTLCRAKEQVGVGDSLCICKKRYFSILHALDFVAEVEDFTFHHRLQAEVARGDQFI